jgi:hypothetical protein
MKWPKWPKGTASNLSSSDLSATATEEHTKEPADTNAQRDITGLPKSLNRNPEIDRLLKESAHLNVTDRLVIGDYVTGGGFSFIREGRLTACLVLERKRVAVKVLCNSHNENGLKVWTVSLKGHVEYVTSFSTGSSP